MTIQPMITKIIHAIRWNYLRQEIYFRDHGERAYTNGDHVTRVACERRGKRWPAANLSVFKDIHGWSQRGVHWAYELSR